MRERKEGAVRGRETKDERGDEEEKMNRKP